MNERMNMLVEDIERIAKEHGVPAPLLYATVATESGGDPDSVRFEPAFLKKYIVNKRPWDALYKKYGNAASSSHGLVQIMYTTAVGLGFEGTPDELREVDANLRMGALVIKQGFTVTGWAPVLVATRYNTGTVHGTPHPGHIERFMRHYKEAKKIYQAAEPETPAKPRIPESDIAIMDLYILPAMRAMYEHTRDITILKDYEIKEIIKRMNDINRVLVEAGLKD